MPAADSPSTLVPNASFGIEDAWRQIAADGRKLAFDSARRSRQKQLTGGALLLVGQREQKQQEGGGDPIQSSRARLLPGVRKRKTHLVQQ